MKFKVLIQVTFNIIDYQLYHSMMKKYIHCKLVILVTVIKYILLTLLHTFLSNLGYFEIFQAYTNLAILKWMKLSFYVGILC